MSVLKESFDLEMLKCKEIINLFQEIFDTKKDTIIIYTRFGYIFLQHLIKDQFQHNKVFTSAEELFQYLIKLWEFEWMFSQGVAAGVQEFEDIESHLTELQKLNRLKIREFYIKEGNKILFR